MTVPLNQLQYLSSFVHPWRKHTSNHNHEFELLKKFVSSSSSVLCLIFILLLLLLPPPYPPSIFSPNSRGQHCLTCNFQTSSPNNPLIKQPISWETFMYSSAGQYLLSCATRLRPWLRWFFLQPALWGLIICERPWRGCKWRLAWERERGMC